MKAVPRRLLVLGGGPVGVELAQAVRRLGGEVVLIERSARVLSREAAPLGEALGEVLRRDGIELVLGAEVTAARREGEDYVVVVDGGRELRGDKLLVAAGRRPRVHAIGLETVGITPSRAASGRLTAARRRAAVGDRRRHRLVAPHPRRKYQGDVVAANLLGEPREANYDAVPRITYTDQQAAAVGATEARFSGTGRLAEIAKTETYTRAYAESNGYLTLLSDGERLTGAHALGPEAGEWLQQATLAIRARVPLDVLRDTIQPFPTFSEIFVDALKALHRERGAQRRPLRSVGDIARRGRPAAGRPAAADRPDRAHGAGRRHGDRTGSALGRDAHGEPGALARAGRRGARRADRGARRRARRAAEPDARRGDEGRAAVLDDRVRRAARGAARRAAGQARDAARRRPAGAVRASSRS